MANSCNQPVRVKFFQFDGGPPTWQWPTDHYAIRSGGTQRIVTSGALGKEVCYDAASENGNLRWGVGLLGGDGCKQCCWTTNATSQTREINLTCQ